MTARVPRDGELGTTEILDRDGQRHGCLAGIGGFIGIVLLAPVALVIRVIRGWKRGRSTLVDRADSAFDGGLTRIDLRVDLASAGVNPFRATLTDVVVRIAETLRQPDDIYHLIFRDVAADETVVLPVGPQLQELGDRFNLVFSQASMAGRTAVWLTLGRGSRVVDVVEPSEYDPEADGEPEGFLARSAMRWGMATTFASDNVSTLFRVVLFVPSESLPSVNTILARLDP